MNKVKIVDEYKTVLEMDYATRSAKVSDLAVEMDVTVPVIRGILVNAKVYKARDREMDCATAAKAAVSKEELVKAFEAVTGQDLKGLNGASRKSLQAVWDYVVSMSDRQNS